MQYYAGNYDIAVIGAGHAGCEAALASARMGMKTLLFSISLEAVANMPCNPHIGGSSKGHLVREIDCLGGEMGKNIDKTFVQMRMLIVHRTHYLDYLQTKFLRYRTSFCIWMWIFCSTESRSFCMMWMWKGMNMPQPETTMVSIF